MERNPEACLERTIPSPVGKPGSAQPTERQFGLRESLTQVEIVEQSGKGTRLMTVTTRVMW